ncbi:PHP domain-containing protein [Cellulomonas sp. zg-ZUI222]|uniref:PHP domain-containing protein n=1 Tax=Cellulomonas wangleii TaxID=2816956 RepID=A0ABX8D1G5_9CELL|nr:PHP domain-containing protein [Cellulomonas wangleii]MBO0920676.1 PHP domain-containing protein [Cellulomonas wangleii]MBO0922906.1 PHP domain-containing protein [Cellulomonas wangleii]QVI61303.1 PHP domain-containing protein [Cellulomonas wangleii]
MRIDLHTHSRASDGTQTPAELVTAARDAGLDVVALTDHDTTDGWDEAAAAARDVGVALVRGTEVSARSRGVSVHLLSYLQDPDRPALADELARARDSRVHRAQRIVERLARDVPITWQDVLDQARDAVAVGRPHIADALVARGVVPDRDVAFAHLLASDGPYHVDHYAPEAPDAVAAIRASGGVPVFAHPAADARGRIVPDRVFDELAEAGLAGLEVFHRDHSPAQRERLLAIAERLGLLVTGSSDYHGTGKLNRLGENLTEPQVLDEIVRQGTTEVVTA